MNDRLKELDFQIAFGAVKHFGRNLYTTNPPAITELIANAWDAYATECRVIMKQDEILIIDNGIGMTDKEFVERYAKSGYEKKYDIRIPRDMKDRPYMGKKGIGKFSAFSLSNNYILYTKSDEDESWKKIELEHDMLDTDQATVKIPVEYEINLSELEKKFEFDIPSTGTLIHLTKLTRKVTQATHSSLAQLISRRFSVTTIIEDDNFELFINDDKVDLNKHFYDNYIEYVYSIGISKEDIKRRFPNVEDENIVITDIDYFDDNNVTGWIASVDKPAKLKSVDGTRITGVTVYINGKVADENIFKNIRDDRLANSYIIGEVDANYLQEEEQDPVLSSREGLNHEIESVRTLRDNLNKVRADLIENWNEMRAKKDITKQEYISQVIEKPQYREMYNALNNDEKIKFKKYAQKLFDKPGESDTNEKVVELYIPAIILLVNDEKINKIADQHGIEVDKLLKIFNELFDVAEINEALRMKSNFDGRLKIINMLKEHIDSGEVEKVFENHLDKNPWLINPAWDRRYVTTKKQDRYKSSEIKELQGVVDIIVETSQELYPIIVELKREKDTSYSKPTVHEIITQINKYRSLIIEEIKRENPGSSIPPTNIKAYFICGNAAEKKLHSSDRELLKMNQIEFDTYEKILEKAKATFILPFETDED